MHKMCETEKCELSVLLFTVYYYYVCAFTTMGVDKTALVGLYNLVSHRYYVSKNNYLGSHQILNRQSLVARYRITQY